MEIPYCPSSSRAVLLCFTKFSTHEQTIHCTLSSTLNCCSNRDVIFMSIKGYIGVHCTMYMYSSTQVGYMRIFDGRRDLLFHHTFMISPLFCQTCYGCTHALEYHLILEWCYLGLTHITYIWRLHILQVLQQLIAIVTERKLAVNIDHCVHTFHQRFVTRQSPMENWVSLVLQDIFGQLFDCMEQCHFPVVLEFYNAHSEVCPSLYKNILSNFFEKHTYITGWFIIIAY